MRRSSMVWDEGWPRVCGQQATTLCRTVVASLSLPLARPRRPRRVARRHGAGRQVPHQRHVGRGGAVDRQALERVPLKIARCVRGAHVLRSGGVVWLMGTVQEQSAAASEPLLTMTRSAAGRCDRASAASHASARVKPGPGGDGGGDDQDSSADESAA